MLEVVATTRGFPPCLVFERGHYSLADKMDRVEIPPIEQRAILYSVRRSTPPGVVKRGRLWILGTGIARVHTFPWYPARQSHAGAHHVVQHRVLVETGGY